MARNKARGKSERKSRAEERQAVANKRSPEEQLARLDKMFGAGMGAVKEREKLHKRIADKQVKTKKKEEK